MKATINIQKISIYVSFTLFISILILSACNKTETVSSIVNQEDSIFYSNGMINFLDSSAYIRYQNWIFNNQNNPNTILERFKNSGFVSMMSIYQEGIKMEEDNPNFSDFVNSYPNVFYQVKCDSSTLYELQAPDILAYICNKDGLFSLEGKIYRISFIFYYVINDGDKSKIPMLFLPQNRLSDKSISIYPTKPKIKGQYYREVKHLIIK